ncbi:MAG: hypothetical protein J6J66_02935 [Clostridia bacterium]|nr:hypothetical protein [Clostridia bacterium]
MSIKNAFGKIFSKKEKKELVPSTDNAVMPFASEAFPVLHLEENQLVNYEKIPLASLAALGTAFSRFPESARTITQTVTKSIDAPKPLFVAVNPKRITGFLQRGKYGITGNITNMNSQGKNVIRGSLEFVEYTPGIHQIENTTTVIPIDPTLMVVAVALMSIEQKLDGIKQGIEDVLQFLKQEKQSKQRGNLNMLSEIMDEYKTHCQNDQFCISRITTVLSIKKQAYQDIDFYQNQITSELKKQKLLHDSNDAQSVLAAVTYQFAEYQLACHLYAFSSFLDVMLQKSFDADVIHSVNEKIRVMKNRYEALYSDCYTQISKYQHSAVGSVFLDAVGNATKGIGKAIGSIPIIKEGSVDEKLIGAGESISKHNEKVIDHRLKAFKALGDDRMTPFEDNLKSIDLLYNEENAMITDGENLYRLKQ